MPSIPLAVQLEREGLALQKELGISVKGRTGSPINQECLALHHKKFFEREKDLRAILIDLKAAQFCVNLYGNAISGNSKAHFIGGMSEEREEGSANDGYSGQEWKLGGGANIESGAKEGEEAVVCIQEHIERAQRKINFI